MIKRPMRMAALALCSTMLLAQAAIVSAAPPVSADQLVCDLSGTCAASIAPVESKPQTRGFSVVHAGAKPAGHSAAPTRARAAPQPAPVHPRGQVGHANLAIAFQQGSAVLLPAGKTAADEFVKALQSPALSGKHFMIGGHTSAVGGRAYNQDLSERRAQAVVDYLVAQGGTRTLFDVKGFGFDQPLPGTRPSAAANRRVEIVVQP